MAELVWNSKISNHAPHSINTYPSEARGAYPQSLFLPPHIYLPDSQQGASSESWQNRLFWGDDQYVLPSLLPEFREKVDLIYIDPPFMTGRTFLAADQLAYKDTWNNDLDLYLQWLHHILTTLYSLLAPDGSLYIHLDWRVSHYVRLLLDQIFGSNFQGNGAGFQNEIIWHYRTGGRSLRRFARKHDTLFFYTKSKEYCFHAERVARKRGNEKRNHMRQNRDAAGRLTWSIRSGGRTYTYNEDSLCYLDDVWDDISHLHQKDPERTGYATQKPALLVERILQASSEENDLVLDCFCGSGVTPLVAERLGRRWLACDQSELAIKMTTERMRKAASLYPFAVQQMSTPI